MLSLVVVMALVGCRTSQEKQPPQIQSVVKPQRLERETVEWVEDSQPDFRTRMNQWAQEGTTVYSFTGPIRRDDGVIVRRAVISRRQP